MKLPLINVLFTSKHKIVTIAKNQLGVEPAISFTTSNLSVNNFKNLDT